MRPKEELMRLAGRHEVLEIVFVEMDRVLDGSCNVLVELVGVGEGYVLLETAVGTGDCILRFTSNSGIHKY
jgi:ubiquinone/menaquinone biosynthesis C-methylase UbiE